MPKRSDMGNLQKLAIAFLEEAALSTAQNADQLRDHIEAGDGWRVIDGVSFLITSAVRAKTDVFIDEMLKNLGVKNGSRSEAKNRSWRFVRDLLASGWPSDLREAAKALIAKLKADAAMIWLFTAPNYTFRLQDGVDIVQIGPVRASRSDLALKSGPSGIQPIIKVGSDTGLHIGANGPEYHLPPFLLASRIDGRI